MTNSNYQPTTGQPCHCKRGQERDNCPDCEGTGKRIDFRKIRGEATPRTAYDELPGDNLKPAQPKEEKGSYRTKDGRAQITWELKQKENGLVFSACGDFQGGSGQCVDHIAKAYPKDETVQRILKIWERYHLNDMKAGTPEQEAEIERRWALDVEKVRHMPDGRKYFYDDEMKDPNPHYLPSVFGYDSHYTWACAILKEAGLLTVKVGEERKNISEVQTTVPVLYTYGHAWLFLPIPDDVLAEIRSWNTNAAEPLTDANAKKFLKDNQLALRITLSDSKPAPWEPCGHHYRITLSGKGRRMTFDFWGSQHDAETGEDPSEYDILSCIAADINTPDTFTGFCNEYGDTPKALQTFNRADRFAKRLRAFFTDEEQEQLQEIR